MAEIHLDFRSASENCGKISVNGDNAELLLGPFTFMGSLPASAAGVANSSSDQNSSYVIKEVVSMSGAAEQEIAEFGRYGVIGFIDSARRGHFSPGSEQIDLYVHGGLQTATGSVATSTPSSIWLADWHMYELMAFVRRFPDSSARITASEFVVSQLPRDRREPNVVQRLVATLLAASPALPFAARPVDAQMCTVYDSGSSFSEVDFKDIAAQQGGNAVAGYVPNSTSGVTIAAGLDLGTTPATRLTEMGFAEKDMSRWAPYLGLIGEKAATALRSSPLSITPADAEAMTYTYYIWAANVIGSQFNQASSKTSKPAKFSDLPSRYQTAMVAMGLTNTSFEKSKAFELFTQSEWKHGIAALKEYACPRASVNKLASLYAERLHKVSLPRNSI